MSTKVEKDRLKQIQDRCQNLLTQMLRDDDNKYCVDCDAKGPRWASWNLGIFLCIRCAGIHRNLGVHISKVKSVNLDTWTPEQVVSLEQMGNSRARAVYEANLPDNFRRPQTDSALESFIRAKYEHKKYIAREWCPPPLPKVNWDKEIEEEEKLKKKKRDSKNSSTTINNTVVKRAENVIPAPLPKPASSPKAGRGSQAASASCPCAPKTPVVPAPTSHSQDLLGLDTPSKERLGEEELFGAVTAVTASSENKPARSQEEESFFSQPAAPAHQQTKMDKDSILALYSAQPTNHFTGGGGGVMFGGGGGLVQNGPSGGGLLAGLGPSLPQARPHLVNQVPHQPMLGGLAVNTSNPFYRMAGAGPPQGGPGLGSGLNVLTPHPSLANTNPLPSQPSLPQPSHNTLMHQLGGLSLGGGDALGQGTVTQNLWQ